MKHIMKTALVSLTAATVFVAAVSGLPGVRDAHAQQANQAPTAGGPQGWFKICDQDQQSGREVCVMNLQVVNEEQRPLASLRLVELEGETQKGFTILLPPGFLLQPGVALQIDSGNRQVAEYQICSPQACRADIQVNEGFVDSLKRGNQLTITVVSPQRQSVQIAATLAGFTAAYDGPPLDPSVVQSPAETLQQQLQRRAEEARQRLLEQSNQDSNQSN